MACFTVPLAEGLIVTALKNTKLFVHKDNKLISDSKSTNNSSINVPTFKEKLGILEKMLYGGSFLLAIEHIYHGEVVLYPPFFTALKSPEETSVMLHEMATVGVGMALIVTLAWGMGCLFHSLIKKTRSKIAGSKIAHVNAGAL